MRLATADTHPPVTPRVRSAHLLVGAVVVLALLGLAAPAAGVVGSQALDVASTLVSLGVVGVCLLVASGLSGRWAVAWCAFAAMMACWTVADVLFALGEVWAVADSLSWLAETLYVLGLLPAVVGMLALPMGRWEPGATARALLDIAVITVPLLLVGDVFLLRHLAGVEVTPWAVYLVVWPVLDVLLATTAVVLSRRRSGRRRADLRFLGMAFGLWAVGDSWLAYVELTGGSYLGSATQVFYLLGPVALALAAVSAWQAENTCESDGMLRHATSRTVALLPEFVVIGAGVACLAVGIEVWHEWVLAGLGALLAAVRQALVASDTQDLRGTLERRVAERTEAQQLLSERLERILDSVGEGIVGIEPDRTISFANVAAARLLGGVRDDLVGHVACEVMCGTDHDECPLDLVARVGEPVSRGETTYRRLDGSMIPVEITATPAGSAPDGATLGAVVAFRDISERRAMEQVKAQFVSSVSHELRTPLSAILGALEMLDDGDGGELPTQAHELVRTAERGAGKLRRLVGDIIDVERLASGTFSVTPRPVAVGSLVCEAVESLSTWAGQLGINLRVERVEGVVLADPDRVEQALVNLVGNAVKFSAAGGTVHLSARETEQEVLVGVRDEGRGIPEADLEHVFDRFHQVAVTDATEKGGTGLGLTITRSIIERHGGRIWVESPPGEGTTFWFTLPRPVPAATPVEPYDVTGVRTRG